MAPCFRHPVGQWQHHIGSGPNGRGAFDVVDGARSLEVAAIIHFTSRRSLNVYVRPFFAASQRSARSATIFWFAWPGGRMDHAKVSVLLQSVVGGSATTAKCRVPPGFGCCAMVAL